MKSYFLGIAALVLLIGNDASAGIVVMDFGNGINELPVTYTEDGFRIQALSTGIPKAANHFDVADLADASSDQEREAAIHGDNNAEDILIDFFGAPFDLEQITIESFVNPTNGGVWYLASSSGASVTITSTGVLNLTGSGWDNITSVQFGDTVKGFGGNVVFDDITFNDSPTVGSVVPEPTSMTLLGIGAISLFCYTRRRSNATQAV